MKNISWQSIDGALWQIKEKLFNVCESVDDANAAIAPLSWYIGTDRAPLEFLRALVNCSGVQFAAIARRLSKSIRGDYSVAIQSVSAYLEKRILEQVR